MHYKERHFIGLNWNVGPETWQYISLALQRFTLTQSSWESDRCLSNARNPLDPPLIPYDYMETPISERRRQSPTVCDRLMIS